MQRVALLAAVAMAVAMSGCFGFGSQRLSDEEARAATDEALRTFAQDFSSPAGGDLRLVRGEFGGQDVDAPMGGDVVFELEWGAEGRSRVALTVSGNRVTYDVSLHCGPEGTVVTFGAERMERRPRQGSCLEAVGGRSDPLDIDELEGHHIEDVEPHRDGSVTATLATDDGTMTVEVDEKGRLERIDFAEGGFLSVDYGQRQVIQMPEPTSLMPVLVFGSGQFAQGQYQWTAFGGDETAPFNDIDVRVLDQSNATAASFTVRSGEQTQEGFVLTFNDDGDGVFGAGDSFTLRSDAWTSADQFEVLVWDTWADREVGDLAIPALPWIAGVGMLIVLALRRR